MVLLIGNRNAFGRWCLLGCGGTAPVAVPGFGFTELRQARTRTSVGSGAGGSVLFLAEPLV